MEGGMQHVESNPLVPDVNQEHCDQLSSTEKICRHIANATGAPIALLLAIVLQIVWVGVGTATHWDPYPFAFLLTCSNILQLVLIFVIAVAQKQQTLHDEIRADADHGTISRLLFHQDVQDRILLKLAEQTGCDVTDLQAKISALLSQDPAGAA